MPEMAARRAHIGDNFGSNLLWPWKNVFYKKSLQFERKIKFENRIFKIDNLRFLDILQGTSIAPSKLLGSAVHFKTGAKIFFFE
jgi:hypothetical protein